MGAPATDDDGRQARAGLGSTAASASGASITAEGALEKLRGAIRCARFFGLGAGRRPREALGTTASRPWTSEIFEGHARRIIPNRTPLRPSSEPVAPVVRRRWRASATIRDVMAERAPISIVIVTFNGRAFLDGCLEATLGQLGPTDELILVDNGSRDDTVSHVRGLYPTV